MSCEVYASSPLSSCLWVLPWKVTDETLRIISWSIHCSARVCALWSSYSLEVYHFAFTTCLFNCLMTVTQLTCEWTSLCTYWACCLTNLSSVSDVCPQGPEDLFETISQAMLNAVDRDAVSGMGVVVHVMWVHFIASSILFCVLPLHLTSASYVCGCDDACMVTT